MLRDATAADLPAIAAITAHYVATTAIHFAYQPPSVAELAALWAARGRHPWLVAVDDGDAATVRGYAKSDRFRARAAYDRTAEVGLYLEPAHRGRGHGRALLDGLVAAMTAAGFHTAVAGIALPNPASVALHERCGFTAVGVFREVGWKFDAWHDVGFWQRPLGPPPAP
ncbi:MAG: N-acetyltransferase [Myxococcales bacterium]|nr:N-acetyltransferase [Myxococcales bacterium]